MKYFVGVRAEAEPFSPYHPWKISCSCKEQVFPRRFIAIQQSKH